MEEAEKKFKIGFIGFFIIIWILFISYEIYPQYLKYKTIEVEGNPHPYYIQTTDYVIEEPAFFGVGCILLICMFFRMMYEGMEELKSHEKIR